MNPGVDMAEEVTRLREIHGRLTRTTLTPDQEEGMRDFDLCVRRLEEKIAFANQDASVRLQCELPRMCSSGTPVRQGSRQQRTQQQQRLQQQQQQHVHLQLQQQQQQQHVQEPFRRSGNDAQRQREISRRSAGSTTAVGDCRKKTKPCPSTDASRRTKLSAPCRPKSSATGPRPIGRDVSGASTMTDEEASDGSDFDTKADRVRAMLSSGTERMQDISRTRTEDSLHLQAQLDNIGNMVTDRNRQRQAERRPQEENQQDPIEGENVEVMSGPRPQETLGPLLHLNSTNYANNNRHVDQDSGEPRNVDEPNLMPDRSVAVNRFPAWKTNQTTPNIGNLSFQESIIFNNQVVHSTLQADPAHKIKNTTGRAPPGSSLDLDVEKGQQKPEVDQEKLENWNWSKCHNEENFPRKRKQTAGEDNMINTGVVVLSDLSDDEHDDAPELGFQRSDVRGDPDGVPAAFDGACSGGACGGADLSDDDSADGYGDEEEQFAANLRRLLQ